MNFEDRLKGVQNKNFDWFCDKDNDEYKFYYKNIYIYSVMYCNTTIPEYQDKAIIFLVNTLNVLDTYEEGKRLEGI